MNVGAGPDLGGPADGLLRCHVGQRSHDGANFGLGRACVDLGQAEVGDLGLAVGRDEHIRRFQVAVYDPSAVCMIDRPGQCFGQGSRRCAVVGALPRSELRERYPLDIFECQVRLTVAFADFVNLHEIGMLALGDGRRFAFEAGAVVGVGMSSRMEQFQCDFSTEGAVPGKIDDSHAAMAKNSQDRRIRQSAVLRQVRPVSLRSDRNLRSPAMRACSSDGSEKRGVNLEQPRQWFSQIGEIDDVIFGQGRLAPNLAEDDFLIDQLDQGLGLAAKRRISVENRLDRRTCSLHPIFDLLGEERVQTKTRVSPSCSDAFPTGPSIIVRLLEPKLADDALDRAIEPIADRVGFLAEFLGHFVPGKARRS